MSHEEALEAIGGIVDHGGDADDVLRNIVELLQEGFEHFSWLGIYLVEGDDLVLGPWRGPEATEHVRIPVGQGICGAAAASGRTGSRWIAPRRIRRTSDRSATLARS